MPIPWMLVGAAAGAGANVLGTYLGKPKKSDYETKANTKGMDKYISYLRGKSQGDEAYQLAMRPQQRAIGKQTAQARRDIQGYMAGQGTEGTAAAAQARLSLQQQTADQLTNVHEQALSQQIQDRRATGDKIAQSTAQRAQAIEDARLQSEQAYKQAQSQWKQQMTQSVVQGLGPVASAGFGQLAQNQANMQAAHQAALSSGVIDPTTTIDQFKTDYKGSDFSSAQAYATSLGAQKTNQSILAQGYEFLGEDKTNELLNAGYTHQDILKEIDYSRQVEQNYITAGVQSGTITADNMRSYFDSMGGGSSLVDTTTNEVIEGGGVTEATTEDLTTTTVPGGEPEAIVEQVTTEPIVEQNISGVIETPPGSGIVSSVGQNITPNRLQNIAGGNLSDPFSIAGQSDAEFSLPTAEDLKANYQREATTQKLIEGGVVPPLNMQEQIELNEQLKEGRERRAADALANVGVEPLDESQYINDAIAAEAAERPTIQEATTESGLPVRDPSFPVTSGPLEAQLKEQERKADLAAANVGVEPFTDPEERELDFSERRAEKRRLRKLDKEEKIRVKELEERSKLEQEQFEAGATSTAMKDQEEALDFEMGKVSEATEQEINDLINNLPPGEYEELQESIGDVEAATTEKKRKGLLKLLEEKIKARFE